MGQGNIALTAFYYIVGSSLMNHLALTRDACKVLQQCYRSIY
jgi:hypothetical protein